MLPVKVDAYLGDRFATEGKALVVVLQIHLAHGCLGTLVEL